MDLFLFAMDLVEFQIWSTENLLYFQAQNWNDDPQWRIHAELAHQSSEVATRGLALCSTMKYYEYYY